MLAVLTATSLVFDIVSWTRVSAGETSDGFEKLAQAVRAKTPACAVVNTSGEIQAWQYAAPAKRFTDFGIGATGTASGVEYFLVSPVAARNHYPNMNPALANYIITKGRLVASYPTRDYGTYRLYYVPAPAGELRPESIDPDTKALYVATAPISCGGFRVSNSTDVQILDAYQALGGQRVLGAPISRRFGSPTGQLQQAFRNAVLRNTSDGVVVARVMTRLLADPLAATDGLPVHQYASRGRHRVTNKVIARGYYGSAHPDGDDRAEALRHWGLPLGPAQRTSDGMIKQAFASVVFEYRPGDDTATLAPISDSLIGTGSVPDSARQVQQGVELPAPPENTNARAWSFYALLAVALGLVVAAWRLGSRRRETRGRRHAAGS